MRMAETLSKLGLYDKRDWFKFTTLKLLASMEKDMYEGRGNRAPRWNGLNKQLRQAKEETKRQKSGKGVF
jgi:hypothetical protein